ncbi:cell division protein FtsQ [Longibacter salinarum]|uniref:Cell division protein FtsQ n=1 Tax=Longibacter salinarum TaxID=1850348 RepID=A0A2A8CXA4_9BACT|nr:FtsQ-type POTRA domain-containing protein [Longibacter salinarum]PEN13253.1 cell division protein FtsQ [Longibacter salinarum]
MDLDTARKIAKLALRLGTIVLVGGGVFVLGLIGWQWQANVPVSVVQVKGARHVHPDTLRMLARVDTGIVMDDLDIGLIADRVQRHPWVQHVDVRQRRSARTLVLGVTERTPAALVIQDNRPAFYLDPAGYAMPLVDSTSFDVPLVRGMAADYHPLNSVAGDGLANFLQTLDGHAAASIITEIDVFANDRIRVYTRPTENHPSVVADLGREQFGVRLKRLVAFHAQVLQAGPDPPVGYVDLRYDNQIVTREATADRRSVAS